MSHSGAGGGANDGEPALARSAQDFATHWHADQRRASDGALFIEHPLEVARLLRDVGCSDTVVAAGLLHDVVEDTPVSVDELRERFGADVAELASRPAARVAWRRCCSPPKTSPWAARGA